MLPRGQLPGCARCNVSRTSSINRQLFPIAARSSTIAIPARTRAIRAPLASMHAWCEIAKLGGRCVGGAATSRHKQVPGRQRTVIACPVIPERLRVVGERTAWHGCAPARAICSAATPADLCHCVWHRAPFSGDGWLFELTHDGFATSRSGTRVQLLWRWGRSMTERFLRRSVSCSAARCCARRLVVPTAEGRRSGRALCRAAERANRNRARFS